MEEEGGAKEIAVHMIRMPQILKQFDERNLAADLDQAEVTDHYNYGFNYFTLRAYINKLKYLREGLCKSERPKYPLNTNGLTRMSDDIPMDLGGLGNLLDPSLLENELLANLDS